MDRLVDMLDGSSPYVRTRALSLIVCNARWDKDGKVDEIDDAYLEHITDAKPITAIQCARALLLIVREKPALRNGIVAALYNADVSTYNGSMRLLVCEGISTALVEILK